MTNGPQRPCQTTPSRWVMNVSHDPSICTKKQEYVVFLVWGKLEHLTCKNSVFATVLTRRVLQQVLEREKVVFNISRVTRNQGDAIFKLYQRLNLTTINRIIWRELCLLRMFSRPFRPLFKSRPSFADKKFCPVFQL